MMRLLLVLLIAASLACACQRNLATTSGDVSVDLLGPVDTRPGTWGCAAAQTWPITFIGPQGMVAHVVRIQGDLIAFPKLIIPALLPVNSYAGVLAGFQTQTPAIKTCDLCDENTPVYVQGVVSSVPTRVPFNYQVNLSLEDGVLSAKVASFLNTLGVPVHLELTYTFTFEWVKAGPAIHPTLNFKTQ